MINIPFLFVLGYRLVEWFSLTQSSRDGPEDGRCSLLTYQGQEIQHNLFLYFFIFYKCKADQYFLQKGCNIT